MIKTNLSCLRQEVGLGWSTSRAVCCLSLLNISHEIKLSQSSRTHTGDNHSVGLTAAGELLAWGYNDNSRLCVVDESGVSINEDKVSKPARVGGPLLGVAVDDVFAFGHLSVAITRDEERSVFIWGCNSGEVIKPKKVTDLSFLWRGEEPSAEQLESGQITRWIEGLVSFFLREKNKEKQESSCQIQ